MRPKLVKNGRRGALQRALGRKLVQKGFQNRGGQKWVIFILRAPWPPDWSQEPGMGPQDRCGAQNDLQIVSKWNLLDEKS